MGELGRVISSTGLVDIAEPVRVDCPRSGLGLMCIKDEYLCLCQILNSWEVGIVREHGQPVAVNLIMKVTPSETGGPQAVLTNIKLMGLVAETRVTNREVHCAFELNKPQNYQVKAFLSEEA